MIIHNLDVGLLGMLGVCLEFGAAWNAWSLLGQCDCLECLEFCLDFGTLGTILILLVCGLLRVLGVCLEFGFLLDASRRSFSFT